MRGAISPFPFQNSSIVQFRLCALLRIFSHPPSSILPMRDEIEGSQLRLERFHNWCTPEPQRLSGFSSRKPTFYDVQRASELWNRSEGRDSGDPPGHLVRYLRNRYAANQSLVRRLRTRRRAPHPGMEHAHTPVAGARHTLRTNCLHKLVDDFMARTLSARAPSAVADKHGVGGEIPAIAPRRIDVA